MRNMMLKKISFILCLVLSISYVLRENNTRVQAAEQKIIKLNSDKTYQQFDLDGDGKKDRLQFVKHVNTDWGSYMCDFFYVYVNGNQVLKIETKDMAYDKSMCAITLFRFENRYFMYVNLMGDNGDGPCNIYVCEKDKLRKVLDINNFMEDVGYHTDAEVQMVGENKFSLRLYSMSYALAASNIVCDFAYKNGKMIPVSKIMKVVNYYNWDEYYNDSNLYSEDRQPYLTIARQLKIYKSFNMKEKKGILDKGEKVKILKCYRGKGKVAYQLKTKDGKMGWFSISEGSELDGQYFMEIMYAG